MIKAGRPVEQKKDTDKPKDEPKEIRLGFDIDRTKHSQLKAYAAANNTTIKAILTAYIDTLIER